MEYFENLVRVPEIETQRSFLSKHEFKLNFNILIRVLDTVEVDASSTPSVNILETFNAYQYRIIAS